MEKKDTSLEIIPANNTDIVTSALWQSNSGVGLPKVATLETILRYNCQLKQRELSVIAANYRWLQNQFGIVLLLF